MRFASWAAVSSLPQAKKISLEDQLAVNREHAARHGGDVVAELVVPGESRNIVLFEDACKIQAYAQLRDMIAARSFDVLIYLDRSRLGRKASLSMSVVELCHEAGIITYETENPPARLDGTQTSHDEMLIGAIKSVGAQREIQKLQERHKMGMIARVQAGKLPAAIPWGWVAVYDIAGQRTIQTDPAAAAAVRTILLDLYLAQGLGHNMIADRLNEMGIITPTGAGQWQKGNVQSILRLVWRYAGYGEVNRRSDRPYTKAPGNWPPILTEEEAQSIQDEQKRRVYGRRGVATAYLFSGVVHCAECGARMSYATTQRNRPTQHRQHSLRCPRHPAIPHRHTHISEPKVRAALDEAIAYLQSPDNRAAVLTDTQHNNAAQIEAEIAQQQAQAAQTQEAIHRADDAYVSGRMDAERYQRQVERLTAQAAATGQRLAELDALQQQSAHEEKRGERLEEVAASGPSVLAGEIRTANAWLKRHLRLWVEDNRVTRIEYL